MSAFILYLFYKYSYSSIHQTTILFLFIFVYSRLIPSLCLVHFKMCVPFRFHSFHSILHGSIGARFSHSLYSLFFFSSFLLSLFYYDKIEYDWMELNCGHVIIALPNLLLVLCLLMMMLIIMLHVCSVVAQIRHSTFPLCTIYHLVANNLH